MKHIPFYTIYPTFLASTFVVSVASVALQNVTLTLPTGSSNHGDPTLICTPSRWTDLAGFYLFNYVAHAATVLIRPGEMPFSFAVTVFGCLLFPTMGAFRGIEALMCGAAFAKSELEKAARSGALCMLVRSPDWKPEAGETIPNGIVRLGQDECSENGVSSAEIQIYQPPWSHRNARGVIGVSSQVKHGAFKVPKGYHWVVVPGNASFVETDDTATNLISSGYSSIKVLVALAQTAYAITTLYRSRGDQIQRYGYAAFGLTVAPYAVMSVVNLLGNLCRPDYAALYVVESSIMDEARCRPGAYFSGSVGRIAEVNSTLQSPSHNSQYLAGIQGRLELSRDVHNQMFVHPQRSSGIYNKDGAPGRSSIIQFDDCSKGPSVTINPTSSEAGVWVYRIPNKSEDLATSEMGNGNVVLLPSCNPLQLQGASPTSQSYRIKHASLEIKRFDSKEKIQRWEVEFEDMLRFHSSHSRNRNLTYAFTLLLGMISVAINGAMSHFRAHASTPVQQSWTMVWLSFGVISGFAFILSDEWERGTEQWQRYTGPWWAPCWKLLSYVGGAAPAIGGFLVVGQMIHEYGSCTRII